jgi:hypothetical protein
MRTYTKYTKAGALVSKFMRTQGISCLSVCQKLSIHPSYLSNALRGRSPFGIDLYDNLVQAYSDLFTEKEKEELYRAVWDGKKELRVDVSGWDIDSKIKLATLAESIKNEIENSKRNKQ